MTHFQSSYGQIRIVRLGWHHAGQRQIEDEGILIHELESLNLAFAGIPMT